MLINFIIAIAFLFDFMNGFHDSANSVATIVSTGVLKPKQAVLWAAFFNFIAFLFFGLHVANTIGQGVVAPEVVTSSVILAALLGAILWNLITWFYGLPSSSMHALIGALGGAVALKSGWGALQFNGFFKIIISIALSPILGSALSFLMLKAERKIFAKTRPGKVDAVSRKLQLVSAALYSLGHGGNDAQKTMGIIAILLYSSGRMTGEFHIPFWVVISCHAAIALGTYFGGWRIIRTMGEKLVKLKPETGCCAETSGALTLFLATQLGIPVSTTHTIAGAIVGVGMADTKQKINWPTIKKILAAWMITIPVSGAFAASIWWLLQKWNIG